MVRAGQNSVMKLRIQKRSRRAVRFAPRFSASAAPMKSRQSRSTTGRSHKTSPEESASVARNSFAQSSSRKFRVSAPQMERLGSEGFANNPLPVLFHEERSQIAPAESLRFQLCASGNDFWFGNGGFFLKAARRDAVFDVRLGTRKWSEIALQHVAPMKGEIHPAVGGRGNRTNRADLVLVPLQSDDAERWAHAGDFRDEQLGHDTDFSFTRRIFEDFEGAAMRWRISTLWPCPRQCAASRSATSRR